jgi:hypothetical protein
MIPAVLALYVVERQEMVTPEAAIASPGGSSLQKRSAATSSRINAANHERRRSEQ